MAPIASARWLNGKWVTSKAHVLWTPITSLAHLLFTLPYSAPATPDSLLTLQLSQDVCLRAFALGVPTARDIFSPNIHNIPLVLCPKAMLLMRFPPLMSLGAFYMLTPYLFPILSHQSQLCGVRDCLIQSYPQHLKCT